MRSVTAVFYFLRHAFFFVIVVASGGPRLKLMLILIKTSFVEKKVKDDTDARKRSNGGITVVDSDHD